MGSAALKLGADGFAGTAEANTAVTPLTLKQSSFLSYVNGNAFGLVFVRE